MATERLQLVGNIGGGIKVESATVGQTIKVKAVDENGKPTEWESVDFPEDGAEVLVLNSLEEMPEQVKDGTIVVVPSEDSGGSESGGEEVVDLTGVFDYAASIAQGGEHITVQYECGEIVERFKKGSVRLRISFGGVVGEQLFNAEIVTVGGEEMARIVSFTVTTDALLYSYTCFNSTTNEIIYNVRKVTTETYIPS